jgi:hypothetical protein
MIKSFHENLRTLRFAFDSQSGFNVSGKRDFVQLHADISFLKHALVYLLKDFAEVERLLDQSMHTIETNAIGMHNFTSADVSFLDSADVGRAVSRAQSEAFSLLGRNSVFFPK